MSLVDFMQELQTQDIVFSTPPEPSIQVIPPEKAVTKVIPPERTEDEVKKPTVIKLKIKQVNVSVNTKPIGEENTIPPTPTQAESPPQPPQETPTQVQDTEPVKEEVVQPQETAESVAVDVSTPTSPVENIPVIKSQVDVDDAPKISEEDQLFLDSGTEIGKKAIWLEMYRRAKASNKVHPMVERMKKGKFIVTDDNKPLVLPDYNIVGKDPDKVLKEQWF